jgi:hypothetical protein
MTDTSIASRESRESAGNAAAAHTTYTLLGQPKISLAQGVQETLTWLRIQPEYQST